TLGGANGGSSGSGGDAGSGNGDGAAATTAARPPWAPLELARETDGGDFAGFVPGAAAGALYSFRLDGAAERPDPASRRQPAGPHGPSQVVDPAAFRWSDAAWRGAGPAGQVIYEAHIGTWTPEGTWEAAARRLPDLAVLGATVVE